MIFNSFSFLFLFLPVTACGFLALPSRWRGAWLLAMSFLFYAISGVEHVVVLAACVVWVWAFSRSERIHGNRLMLTMAVAGPLAALFYYKYLTFLVVDVLGLQASDLSWLGSSADKLLPAGISFFTFHLVAYAFDRYRGQLTPHPSARDFSLYICFFPHLVAGPILRYANVSDALARIGRFRPDRDAVVRAISYLTFGLAAKVLIADTLSGHVVTLAEQVDKLTGVAAAFVLFAYSFQIYFDFYGYSLMAMGLAFFFGFEFPRNFDRPYSARDPRDFWRRWHITLGSWIRDYIYIPLGGNNAFARNILITFFICGLWHGAAWQFAVWGLYHGALVVAVSKVRPSWERLPIFVQQGATFALVSLGWVLFLFDFEQAKTFLVSLAGQAATPTVGGPGPEGWAMLAVAAAVCYLVKAEEWTERAIRSRRWVDARSVAYAGLFLMSILLMDRSSDFIYFRF